MTSSCARCLLATLLFTVIFVAGCSSRQKSGRPDIDAIPDVELRTKATKAAIYEFRAKVKKRGVAAAKQDLPDLLSSFEGYEKHKLGEHKETYKQIVEKLNAMQAGLGSATKDSLNKAVDEIGALADKLPGQANPNPVVE